MIAFFSNLATDNTVAVTQQLLYKLTIPFSYTAVNEAIKQHPDYPSIAAIHDVLSRYKTENIVLQVDKDKLKEVPVPFVAHLKQKPNGFVTVTSVKENEVAYLTQGSLRKETTVTTNEFISRWSGVALLAEKNEQSGEQELEQNQKQDRIAFYRIPLLILSLATLLFTAILPFETATVSIAVPLVLKLAGVVVCSLLLWYEIDRNNPFLQKVCNSTKATNCNAVLQSNAAKLFGVISWSEIGFFYFTGGLLFVIFTINPSLRGTKQSLEMLAWLNVLALPYTVFSVVYQWRVTKQWCPLCLAIQALLALEAFYFIGVGHLQQFAVTEIVPPFVLAFLLPVTAWYFVKPLLKKNKEAEEYKNRFYRIKNDSRIFEALLEKQKKITIAPDGLGIRLGNPDARHTIVKVCNPYCGPCAKAHPDMHSLLHNNPNLAVQIIFTPAADEKDYRNKPVKHLLAVAEKQNEQLTEQGIG